MNHEQTIFLKVSTKIKGLVFVLGLVTLFILAFATIVFADTPPSVSINSPSNNTTYYVPSSVSIVAVANSSVSTISKIEFYDGDILKCTETASTPSVLLSCTWSVTAADNGTHSWTAKAYDALGGITTSNPINLTVIIEGTSPVVSAWDIQPRIISGGVLTYSFTVTDTGGSHIKSVQLWRALYNTTGCTAVLNSNCSWARVKTSTAPSGLDTWTNSFTSIMPAIGSTYVYGFQVFDNSGNKTAYDQNNRFEVSAIVDPSPPVVSITSPSDGTVYNTKAIVSIEASATSTSEAEITKVEFYLESYLGLSHECTVTVAPYTCNWDIRNIFSGVYSWTVKAYNSMGTVTTSAPVNLTVDLETVKPVLSNVKFEPEYDNVRIYFNSDQPVKPKLEFPLQPWPCTENHPALCIVELPNYFGGSLSRNIMPHLQA